MSKLSQRSRLCSRFSEFTGIAVAIVEIKEIGGRIKDTEGGKINKFRGATVSLGDTDSHPRGRRLQAGWMLSKQRVAPVHVEDFCDFSRLVGCTLRLRGLFPPPLHPPLRPSLLRVCPYAISLFSPSVFPRASAASESHARMQSTRHRNASTSRRRVAGIRFERGEYYACEKQTREKNRGDRAEFSKNPTRNDSAWRSNS